MVSLSSLWLPILLSAVFVFVASSIAHTVLPHHHSDFRKFPAEDDVMEALRRFALPPGDYMMPRPDGPRGMKEPDYLAKVSKGPIALMTVLPSGPPSMAKNLIQWFVYCVIVSGFAGYVAGRALEPGTPYLTVFRFAGTVAFAGYGLALMQQSIWFGRAWSTTLKSMLDALVYALLTAGTFGWLWPR